MTSLADENARRRALTDFGSTLLVEAGAGTGKTSLMAGRLVLLLASGVDPSGIAAIAFTELSASELAARIRRFISDLLAGRIPVGLEIALPAGLSSEQQEALRAASTRIDELSAMTIHGFCQAMIRGYAVEAEIDPGFRVMDAVETAFAFRSVFERWLKRRLEVSASLSDPIADISRRSPRKVADTFFDLSEFRRKHRIAKPLAPDLDENADCDFTDSVSEFRRWYSKVPPEPQTGSDIDQLEQLAAFYQGRFNPRPDFATLWDLAHPKDHKIMRKRTTDLQDYRRLTAWRKMSRQDGDRLNEEAAALYERARSAFREMRGRIATSIIAALSVEVEGVLADFETFKSSAAILDFDDLLHRALELLRKHDNVRRALGARYRYVFVDEFQDTDPVQAEILFLLCGEGAAEGPWDTRELRPGALFMVGDPKQAIYRFRGADVGSYERAKKAVSGRSPENLIRITSNFRSHLDILKHVNRCFEPVLSAEGQPGYDHLASNITQVDHGIPCVVKLTVRPALSPTAAAMRDAEAEAVADICARLIGNIRVRTRIGETVPLLPGHIALLAPTGAELWRYERALDERGLPIASQAGKAIFLRQETKDFVALVRVLSDSRDTLAFGALMRGPLVGLSEEELLDIVAALPSEPEYPERIPQFSLRTDPSLVSHTVARDVLMILRDLRNRTWTTTPHLLLSEAVERLRVRPTLVARHNDRNTRALANLDALLERARPYGVRGLKRFAFDLKSAWAGRVGEREGRIDSEGMAIEIITMHSAKGLEWPVVIPINGTTEISKTEPFIHCRSDNTLHWIVGDVIPPGIATALQLEMQAQRREHERLWYVSCTRAKELLIVPQVEGAPANSWARILNLGQSALPELEVARLSPKPFTRSDGAINQQTSAMFEGETSRIANTVRRLRWQRPSDADSDRLDYEFEPSLDVDGDADRILPVGGGVIRGLILHKLMEEILDGALKDDAAALATRATTLIGQLVKETDIGVDRPEPSEMAATILRTLSLPEIVAARPLLRAEYPVLADVSDGEEEVLITGRADAVVVESGHVTMVVDWKSDVVPSVASHREYERQIEQYRRALGADRAAVVYMTTGKFNLVGNGKL